jgi:hypothetical protein
VRRISSWPERCIRSPLASSFERAATAASTPTSDHTEISLHTQTEDMNMDQQNVGSKRSASGGSGKIAAKSHEAAEHWKETVVEQANQVRDKARSAKEHTGDRIRGVATQLRNVSDSLREEDPLASELAERASRGIEGVAQYVSSTSAQSLIRDTEQLARRQPALFFGGAFLLGLAAGRFIKASSPQSSFARPSYDEDEGGPLARRQDRESGFFPPAENAGVGGQRYRENYDATFGRDVDQRGSMVGETSQTERTRYGSESNRTTPQPYRSETEGNGAEATGTPAGRGNRP